MKNIYLITAVLFLFSISFTSAVIIPNQQFHLPIGNLELSPDLTFEKVVQLCTRESCIIDNEARTITILSHYDDRVALTFSQFVNQNIQMDTRIPYDTAANDTANEPYKTPIIRDINPADYNWEESIRTDLTWLKEVGVLAISNEDITNIIDAYNRGETTATEEDKGKWHYFCNLIYKIPTDEDWMIGCAADINAQQPSPILPSQEFMSNNQKSNNLIYWTVGIAVVLIVILFLVFRKRK